MEWTSGDGQVSITPKGTPRAVEYYYTVREGAYRYRAGRFIFGEKVYFTKNGSPRTWSTLEQARAYCESHNANI